LPKKFLTPKKSSTTCKKPAASAKPQNVENPAQSAGAIDDGRKKDLANGVLALHFARWPDCL
jgi:hypothetical protein